MNSLAERRYLGQVAWRHVRDYICNLFIDPPPPPLPFEDRWNTAFGLLIQQDAKGAFVQKEIAYVLKKIDPSLKRDGFGDAVVLELDPKLLDETDDASYLPKRVLEQNPNLVLRLSISNIELTVGGHKDAKIALGFEEREPKREEKGSFRSRGSSSIEIHALTTKRKLGHLRVKRIIEGQEVVGGLGGLFPDSYSMTTAYTLVKIADQIAESMKPSPPPRQFNVS